VADVIDFNAGEYRFIKGGYQFSGGVTANAGFEIVRVRFAKPVSLDVGFVRIESYLAKMGRPVSALCACELRSPEPFDDAGFVAFNRGYIEPLQRWGIIRDDINPIARSNVCPAVNPPKEPSFYSFSYTRKTDDATARSFVLSGSAEAPDGPGTYKERAIRFGDHSPDGLREKLRWILGEMEAHMGALGLGWHNATAMQLYTVHDIHHLMAKDIVARGAADTGLTWHFCRPPIDGLDCEVDVRGVGAELLAP
jgi:hypothetical protein